MAASQITYNPGILGDEVLARSFVVRQQSLELILEALRENAASQAPNLHLLMIGPRGIGKTMLVRRAAAAVRSDATYSTKWYPLVFGEESYPVGTPGEFWLEAIFHLADQTEDPKLSKTFEELRDERNDSRLRSRALGQLLDFADHEKKRVLLVVENLNILIGEQMNADAAWDLRHTLMNESRLMLLGTATNRFDEIANIGHAWFEMFAVQQLQPLNVEESGELWRSVTGTPLKRGQVKAIRILTGGNPRLIAILAGFAANHSFRQLLEQLVHLIDDHTEYFKGHLDSLAVKERRVFVALLETWDPVSAAELARQTRLSVNEVSALLGRLTTRGAVEVAQQRGRKKLYQAAERLYNVYYLMRRRGHPEGRVQAAVRFMISFYEREDLVAQLGDLAREACALPEGIRDDHYCAYAEVLRSIEGIATQVIERTPPEFFQSPNAKLAREAGINGLIQEGMHFLDKREFHNAEVLYRRALELDERNATVWGGLAFSLSASADNSRYAEAEQAFHRTIQLKPDWAFVFWNGLGWLLIKQERWNEAEEAFLKAIALDQKRVMNWRGLGQVYCQLGRWQEAEKTFRSAIQLEPDSHSHWHHLGTALWRLDRPEEAVDAFQQAVALDPGCATCWESFGHLLLEINSNELAETVWSQALELHGKELASCSVHLLDLRLARGVDESAISQEAENWISRSERRPETLAVMTKFFVTRGLDKDLLRAEAWAREAFAQQPNTRTAEALALVLAVKGRWQEAIQYSKTVLDSSADDKQAAQISTEFIILVAAQGWAAEALATVKASKGSAALEPLIVGLQIYLGESPVVAKEILEIGQDVAERIRRAEGAAESSVEKAG